MISILKTMLHWYEKYIETIFFNVEIFLRASLNK